jgi:hypothetical protein
MSTQNSATMNTSLNSKKTPWISSWNGFVDPVNIQPDSNITNIALVNGVRKPAELLFLDSTLNIRKYSTVQIYFNIDSAYANLSIQLAKNSSNVLVSADMLDSVFHQEKINATKGRNMISFQAGKAPITGTGYILSFVGTDTTADGDGYVSVNHITVNLIQ